MRRSLSLRCFWLKAGPDPEAIVAIERVFQQNRELAAESYSGRHFTVHDAQSRILETKRRLAALEVHWNIRLDSAALQAELDRIARASKDTAMLRRLFAAVGDDPAQFVEAYIVPAEAQRMLRTAYERETAGTASHESFDAWWTRERELIDVRKIAYPQGRYFLPEIAEAGTQHDTWVPIFDELAQRYFHSAVWTGSEVLIWGGRGPYVTGAEGPLRNGYRYNPATDTWAVISTEGAPEARFDHFAVWTGSEMLVWGGRMAGGVKDNLNPEGLILANDGARYDPAADTWTPMAETALVGRMEASGVWTGSRFIVWGGRSLPTDVGVMTHYGDGAMYDPATNSWAAVNTNGAPSPRKSHKAVWTGSHMILWGGSSGTTYNNGFKFDPNGNTWTPITSTAAPTARNRETAVWTGSEMVIFGGHGTGGELATGARYDPAADQWRSMATAGAPAKGGHVAVWTGDEMLVWAGQGPQADVLGRYSPASDAWSTGSSESAPEARVYLAQPIWTGSEMITWGGNAGVVSHSREGGRYKPGTDEWIPMSPAPAPSTQAYDHRMVWTGAEMIIVGGNDSSSIASRYVPATGTWRTVSETGAPTPRKRHTAIWNGSGVMVWGGAAEDGTHRADGAIYDPVFDVWSPIAAGGAPATRVDHFAAWTGTEMLIWGGSVGTEGALYDPATEMWRAVTSAGISLSAPVIVWTGTEMIVWGGYRGSTDFDTGARYNPAKDAWSPMSAVSAPSGRRNATIVWTGAEAIVWGGYALNLVIRSADAGAYDPCQDSWLPVQTENAPSPRYRHQAIWAGDRMLIWGGSTADGSLASGGAYFRDVAEVDLRVAMTDSPDPITEGGSLTYAITVTNLGPDVAQCITLTDVLPTGVVAVEANTTSGACTVGEAVVCSLDPLAMNATASVNIVVTAGGAGEIVNSVRVTSQQVDTNPADNVATASTTLASSLEAPSQLSATALSATTVRVTWQPVAGAANYEVWRSADGANWTAAASVSGPPYDDPDLTAATSYLYKARAIDTESRPTMFSNRDVATTVVFVDAPLASQTRVKAIHLTQLRTAVNALRAAAGLAPVSFSPSSLAGREIETTHIQSLRDALAAARSQLLLPAVDFADPALVTHLTVIRKQHIEDLRSGVR